MKNRFFAGLTLGVLLGLAGYHALSSSPSSAQTETGFDWLPSDTASAIGAIEKQLRGMDVTMMEIGHRFDEMYHAGLERNWPLAEYHLEKMESALRLALLRRPARGASARPFLDETLPESGRLLDQREPESFAQAMNVLRTGCMQCHVAEDLPHFTVTFPAERQRQHAPAAAGRDGFWE